MVCCKTVHRSWKIVINNWIIVIVEILSTKIYILNLVLGVGNLSRKVVVGKLSVYFINILRNWIIVYRYMNVCVTIVGKLSMLVANLS